MTIKELIERANKGYQQTKLLENWQTNHENDLLSLPSSDVVGLFIVNLIADSYDPDDTDQAQLYAAWKTMQNVITVFQNVTKELIEEKNNETM